MNSQLFRFSIANGASLALHISVEPEAEVYYLPPMSSIDVIDVYEHDDEPISLFFFDTGVSIYGHTLYLFHLGYELRRRHYPRVLLDATHSITVPERDERCDFASVPGTSLPLMFSDLAENSHPVIELYRPSETNAALPVVLPDQQGILLQPGERYLKKLSVRSGRQLLITIARDAVSLTEASSSPPLQSSHVITPSDDATRLVYDALGNVGNAVTRLRERSDGTVEETIQASSQWYSSARKHSPLARLSDAEVVSALHMLWIMGKAAPSVAVSSVNPDEYLVEWVRVAPSPGQSQASPTGALSSRAGQNTAP